MSAAHVESDNEIARQLFVDFDEQLMHWRDHLFGCPFYRQGLDFDDYGPAFKLGIHVFLRSHGRSFSDVKDQLGESYERTRGASRLDWPDASAAAAAAWQRMAELRARRHTPGAAAGVGPRTLRPQRTQHEGSQRH